MEINVNRVNDANATATAIVPNETFDKQLDKVAKDAAKNMKIDGFRKGKVPIAVIKSRYSEQLTQDANQSILKEVLDKAIKDLEIAAEKIIGDPQVTKFDKGESKIEVEIKIGITPEIDLSKVESCIPDVKVEDVTDSEVDERIKEMALSQAPLEKIARARALKNGDFAVIDFEGFIDDKAMENGKADNYTLEIGSSSFIEGFEEQLIGMKPKEEKEIEVTFPENYGNADTAGKVAKFKVTLNGIQTKKEIPIDDEFAKTVLPNEKEATIDLLKEKVKEQLQNEKKSKLYNEDLKPRVLESFAETIIFDVPDFVVEQETDMAFRNSLQTMEREEIEKLQTDAEALKAKREEFKGDAEKSVKVTFVVDALAKQEKIEVSDNEIVQTIYYEAMSSGQNPQETLKLYQERGLIPAIKMSMIEDRLLSHLLDKKLKG